MRQRLIQQSFAGLGQIREQQQGVQCWPYVREASLSSQHRRR
ncbi:hypothetical protein SynBOUM118_00486 [Synechococcus sp. BOUM118]|nr:hypothetical protein SynBOUM118_00486 [Synechococcus sp. BOUM118]